jgi:PD-(D/E)XK nuclease superfamily
VKLPIGSYSFYNAFENCPHKAFQIYVARTIPYVESPEMAWGNKVHAAMENRIRDGVPLPEEMSAAENAAATFHEMGKKLPLQVEYKLAMTAKGEPCAWQDWDKVWFRGKLDCVVMDDARTFAWTVDWKTGNVREEPFELETGALLLKVNYEHLRDVKGEYFWMKTGQNGLRYTLNQHDKTFAKLQSLRNEAETYFRAGEWPKRKNPLCGWCPVKECEHNKSGRRK